MQNKTYFLSIIFLTIYSCKPTCEKKGGHDAYTIENKSNRNIEYKIMDYFSDSTIPYDYNPKIDQIGPIKPHSSVSSWVKLRKGECIEDLYSNREKNWIYFFDADTIAVLPWDTIRMTNRGVLVRKLIDLEYLKINGFRLVYE